MPQTKFDPMNLAQHASEAILYFKSLGVPIEKVIDDVAIAHADKISLDAISISNDPTNGVVADLIARMSPHGRVRRAPNDEVKRHLIPLGFGVVAYCAFKAKGEDYTGFYEFLGAFQKRNKPKETQ